MITRLDQMSAETAAAVRATLQSAALRGSDRSNEAGKTAKPQVEVADGSSQDPVIATIRAAGLKGFKAFGPDAGASPAAGKMSAQGATVDPVIAMIHASGIPGFKPGGDGR